MSEFTLDEENNASAESVAAQQPIQKAAAPVEKPKEDTKKTLWLNVTNLEEEDIDELLETLSYYGGDTEVFFVQNGKKMRCTQKVSPNKALMAELCSFLPENCIKLL
jgi:hypothetical protein